MAKNLQLLVKTHHRHLPAFSALLRQAVRNTSQWEPLAEVFMPWKQLAPLHRAYFASKTAPTLNHSKAPAQPYQEAFPDGGINLHIQGLDMQP